MRGTGKEMGSYLLVSASQTFVEFGTFALLQLLTVPAPIPSAVSIFVSGCWNYLLNRNITFQSSANYIRSILEFILLYVWNFIFFIYYAAAFASSFRLESSAGKTVHHGLSSHLGLFAL